MKLRALIVGWLLVLSSQSRADENIWGVDELLAPHPNGAVGLFRTYSAARRNAGPGSFSFSLTSTYMNLDNFPTTGQDAERLGGKGALSFTPFHNLELFLAGWGFTSNDTDPTLLIQQFGNLDYGAKLGFDFGANISVASLFTGRFQKSAADLGFSTRAYTYDALLAGTYDFLIHKFPLRIHLNGGYRWDGTDDLLPLTADERSRVLLEVLGKNAILGAVGIEMPLPPVSMSVEYSTEQTIDTSGVGYGDNPQRITLGLRYFPMKSRALALEGAGNIGFFAADDASRLVREPSWSILVGMAYNFGAVTKGKPEAKLAEVLPTGFVTGVVTEDKTGQPVGNARIRFCVKNTSAVAVDRDHGTYLSYALPAGDCPLEVSAEGYKSLSGTVKVVTDQTTAMNFVLTRQEGPRGAVLIQVKDSAGNPVQGTISIPDFPQAQAMETDEKGRLRIKLPVGMYRFEATSQGLSAEPQQLDVLEDKEIPADFVLRSPVRARLGSSEITVSHQIQFESSQMALTPESKKILDEVASILKSHPEIKKVEVGGHTDSTGTNEGNKSLSQSRAEAVVKYLQSQGVLAERLSAMGYGEEKPIVSNKTKEGRMKNRRVEFKIIEKQ